MVRLGLTVVLAVLACLFAVAASAAECSGYYTRSDGAYPGKFFGLTEASRDAELDAWCAAPCTIAGSNHAAASFDYAGDATAVGGGPFAGTFIDDAGADCTNAAFAGGGGTPPPAGAASDPVAQFEGSVLTHVVALTGLVLVFGVAYVAGRIR